MPDHDDLAARLDDIAEEIRERAIATLRDALSDPGRRLEAGAEEKRLQKARRSVEKAAAHLRGPGDTYDD